METWIRFGLLGLGPGGIYALSALGIVIAYRASGTLNFAGGAMGALAAFFFYELRDGFGMAWPLALAATLALGAAMGAALQLGVLAQLRNSSPLTKLIATLGALTVYQGLAIAIWDDEQRLVRSVLNTAQVNFGDSISVGRDRLTLLGMAVVLAALLALLYRKTLFGLATTAVAENRRAAAGVGWSAGRIELYNWMIGGALSALAGVFLVPITGLRATTLSLLVIPALAAALIGGFSSFTLTVLGGLVIGVVESELSRYNGDVPGISQAVPFLIVVVVLMAGGRARPTRGDLPTRLPRPGTGRVLPALSIVAAAAAIAFALLASDAWATSLIYAAIGALMVLSVVVVTGFGGQLSLGQWALAGFAAWVSSRLALTTSLGFWASAAIAVAATVPAAVIVGLPALRSRGVSLAIATAGLALFIEAMILGNAELTGGIDGTETTPPRFFGIELDAVLTPRRYAVFALVIVAVSALAAANVRRSRSGLRLLSVRGNERAAAALGINVFGVKLYAFALASAFAALAGVLAAFQNRFVLFGQFNVFGSIEYVTYSVIGGIGWVLGAMLSSLVVPESILPKAAEGLFDPGDWIVVILGVVVLIVIMAAPEGIAARLAALGRRIRAPRAPKDAPVIERRPHNDRTVRIEGLSVHFGGVAALEGVSMEIRPRQITGLIGPNGAGKTTLLDAVTGFAKPTGGRVVVDDRDITSLSPTRRARLGMGRSFQAVELFEEMSVRENLLSAVEHHKTACYLSDPFKPGRLPVSELMLRVVEDFGLEGCLSAHPSELPGGLRRIVGIARALLSEPSVLFLDEPAAGLDGRETAALGELLVRIVEDYQIAIVLVEHDVPLVLGICSHIVVLDFGRKIAEGPPESIKRDPRVIAAYLGSDEGETAAPAADQKSTGQPSAGENVATAESATAEAASAGDPAPAGEAE